MNILFSDALKRVLSISTPINQNSFLSIFHALNYICAEDIVCKKDLPSFDNSAMDGYGFKFKEKDEILKIKKTVLAGENIRGCLKKNECYKIMTGALTPNDMDTVVAFENAIKIDENHIKIPHDIKKHNAYRFKGEEQKKGSVIFSKGTLLTPSEIMMCASQGITNINVFVKPKIAVISTGDEIKEPWENIEDDKIYNCNTSGVIGILNYYGFKADYVGVVPDDLKKSVNFFKNLKQFYDIIISSGGVSMGEADFILDALNQNGFKEEFHGINLKPGRPTLCGTMDNVVVISLPGNPMAAFLNAFLLGLPAIKKCAGYLNPYHKKIKAINKKEFNFKPNRTNIILGNYENGDFIVTNNNKFGSGMITPLVKSNCLVLSKESESGYKINDEIEVILF